MEKNPYLHVKRCLAREVISQIVPGMILGLGSGSTAREFILALADKIHKEGIEIQAIASSCASHTLANSLRIPLLNSESFSSIDLAVDGADEIDLQLRMIKGGGGALFREKILLQAAKRKIILADESKKVAVLGKFGLPVEISRFGSCAIAKELIRQGYCGSWRFQSNGELFLTDSGNYIYDIRVPELYPQPEKDLLRLLQIHGVIEVGFVIENVEVWFINNQGQISKEYSVAI
ncbi:ribose 5-phosphate isomerase A [Candidatus Chlamydia sanziniae]|uniref:ribose 5-phosphate isomerase A n=1 Tax=Candidatus Chlamydia sanziniae TaxID=1806891 RepID=UPI000835CAA0|nr:ribose 5-phosphate isomerase A [Candidatus Chlamydia sanziniae]